MSVDPYPEFAQEQAALDATLLALADLATSANTAPYFTGIDAAALMTVTPFMRTVLDDADAASVRQTLGAAPVLGSANYLLYYGPTGVLSEDSNFTYDEDENQMRIDKLDVYHAISIDSLGGPFDPYALYVGNNRPSYFDGPVGINRANPDWYLEVDGDVKFYGGLWLGAAFYTAQDGFIQYTGTDFEGRKAGAWVSLTSPEYAEGSFTVTTTGFSGTAPSATATWRRVGKQVTITFPFLYGTSNAGFFRLTSIPAALQTTKTQYFAVPAINSDTHLTGVIYVRSGATWDVQRDAGGSLMFAATGGKGMMDVTITYQLP